MADSLISKVFNEGAPLDPNELNNLRTDIINTYAKANVLYNSTVNGQTQAYKNIFNSGRATITGIKAGVNAYTDIDLGNGFDTNQPHPVVVATVSSALATGESITTWVTSASGGFTGWKIYILSNKARTSLTVDWMAIQKVPV